VVVAVIPQIITYIAKLVFLPSAVVTGNGVIKSRLDFMFLISKSVAACVIIVLRARLDHDDSRNLDLSLGVSQRHWEGGGEGDRGNRDIHDLHGHWGFHLSSVIEVGSGAPSWIASETTYEGI
jgi:hypothetical protein